MANVIHWDLAGKCGFSDRKNVKIKVLQVLRRCVGEESRLHWIHTWGCEADIVRGINIISLG